MTTAIQSPTATDTSSTESSHMHCGIMHAEVTSMHGKRHRIVFDRVRNVFDFFLVESESEKVSYRIDELLAVRASPIKVRRGILAPLPERAETTARSLFMYLVFKKNEFKWRLLQIGVTFSSASERDHWLATIQLILKKLENRPRRILVYINPFGGKGKAPKIYKELVEPVFQLAGLEVETVFTEHANHAKEHIRSVTEWSSLDGVVSVGGDGLFNEVLSGALNRTQEEHGVDQDNSSSSLRTPHFRFGIIGAGSANSIVSTVHKTDDYATSALHIAIGSYCLVDACTVHCGESLLRVSADAISYGWLGDVLRDSERYRCLGPIRYQWSALRTTIRNPTYRGCVTFTLSHKETTNPKEKLANCIQPCPECERDPSAEKTFHWKADFSHVICCVIPCVTPFTPLGLAPFTGLGDGSLDLCLVPKISRWHNLQFMRKVAMYGGKGLYELDPSLNCYRVSKWTFHPDPALEDPGVWNLDGEILEQPRDSTLEFSLHPRLIAFFGRDKDVIAPFKRSFLRKRRSSILYR